MSLRLNMSKLIVDIKDGIKLVGYRGFIYFFGTFYPGATFEAELIPAKPQDCFIIDKITFFDTPKNTFFLRIEHRDMGVFEEILREDIIVEGLELPRIVFMVVEYPLKVTVTNISNVTESFGMHFHTTFADKEWAFRIRDKLEDLKKVWL